MVDYFLPGNLPPSDNGRPNGLNQEGQTYRAVFIEKPLIEADWKEVRAGPWRDSFDAAVTDGEAWVQTMYMCRAPSNPPIPGNPPASVPVLKPATPRKRHEIEEADRTPPPGHVLSYTVWPLKLINSFRSEVIFPLLGPFASRQEAVTAAKRWLAGCNADDAFLYGVKIYPHISAAKGSTS
jgi:hypothetical protein